MNIKDYYIIHKDRFGKVLKMSGPYFTFRDAIHQVSFMYSDFKYKITKVYEQNFIVASSCEIDLNYPNNRKNYNTVWLVDFEKSTVRCLNGITGYESYYIEDILKFDGDIFAPCAGTKGSWNRLEVNYSELKEQLERIIGEQNKEIARKKLHKLNAEIIREEINNENS